MIKIKKGKKETEVSRKSYESVFKHSGWKEAGAGGMTEHEHAESSEESEFSTEAAGEQRESEEDVDKIPISEMTKGQLFAYAKKHNIDTSSAKSVGDARKIIRTAVRERKMAQ